MNDSNEMTPLYRRRMLQVTGAVGITALAGCSGDDSSGSDGGDNGDSNDNGSGGNDNGSSDDSESEDSEESGGLEINEHELVVEGDTVEEVFVEGIVENTGDSSVDYAEVRVKVYDPEGNQMDEYFTNTENLEAGATWAFEVMILDESDEIDTENYDISVSDSAF